MDIFFKRITYSTMLGVAIVKNKMFFQNCSKIFNFLEIRTSGTNICGFALKKKKNITKSKLQHCARKLVVKLVECEVF